VYTGSKLENERLNNHWLYTWWNASYNCSYLVDWKQCTGNMYL